MDLTNDAYVIVFHSGAAKGAERMEKYCRDPRSTTDTKPWVKVSTRGNQFRATAEQVLNHLLPALAGFHPNLTVEVQHHPNETAHNA